MKDAGSPPQSPDPRITIPLQGQENRNTFDYMLGQQRVNQTSPYGSQTWTKTPTFDEAKYNAALADWEKQYGGSSAAPQPGQTASGGAAWQPWDRFGSNGADGGSNGGTVFNGAINPTSGATPPKPTKDQFTTYDWTYNQAFSPEQQKLYDQNVASQLQQGAMLDALGRRVQSATANPMDWSSAPGLRGTLDAPNMTNPAFGAINRGQMPGELSGLLQGLGGKMGSLDPMNFNTEASDALYRQNTRYLDEQTNQQQKALEARLAEQGFVPGTPGYAQAMRNFQNTNARAYADARDRALTMGTQVGNQAFGNSLQALQAQIAAALQGGQFDLSRQGQDFGQQSTLSNMQRQQGLDANQVAQQLFADNQAGAVFQNQARNQAIAELLQQRNQPLNELNAMRTGTQVQLPNNPAQYSTPNLQPVDVMGAYQQKYAGDLGAYNAQVAGDNSMFGNLLNAGLLYSTGGMSGLFSGLGASPGAGGQGYYGGLKIPGQL